MTWLTYMTSEWKKRFEIKESMQSISQKKAQKRILSSRRTGTLLVKTGDRPILLTGARNLLSCMKTPLRSIKPFNHLYQCKAKRFT